MLSSKSPTITVALLGSILLIKWSKHGKKLWKLNVGDRYRILWYLLLVAGRVSCDSSVTKTWKWNLWFCHFVWCCAYNLSSCVTSPTDWLHARGTRFSSVGWTEEWLSTICLYYDTWLSQQANESLPDCTNIIPLPYYVQILVAILLSPTLNRALVSVQYEGLESEYTIMWSFFFFECESLN